MRYRLLFIWIFGIWMLSCKEVPKSDLAKSEVFELAPPQVKIDSTLFNKTANIEVDFAMPDAEIRYTIDGSQVTQDDNLYTNPLIIDKSSVYTFKAFHPEYQNSKEISARLVKLKNNISRASVTVAPEPHPNYSGDGAKALVDLKKGTLQFRDGKKWLGFQYEQVNVQLNFENEIFVSKLILSTLNDHGSWIFMPKSVRVMANNREVGFLELDEPKMPEPKEIKFLDIEIEGKMYKTLKIQIDILNKIPEWHQGKGSPSFFFIDEILVE